MNGSALRELPLPAPVSYAPQTIGWLVVLLLMIALGAMFAWIAWRRYERGRYRREALAELDGIEQRLKHDKAALANIAPLIKRTALAAAPREQVASLSGAAWLAYLRKAHHSFDDESGALLHTSTYAPHTALDSITPQQTDRLVNAARAWIEHHHVEV